MKTLRRPPLLSSLFTLLLLLWGGALLAQTRLTGRVLDAQTQEALGYATVVLKAAGPENKVVQSALTDEAGQFALTPVGAGTYQFSVLMLGFITHEQTVQVAGTAPTQDLGTVALALAAQHLGEVVVTGQRQLIEQKADRVVMNLDGSMLAAGNDAYRILATAPAVQLIDGRLSFRGKSNVLILLNGKRLPGANLEAVLASIPGDQIDRIELISNPSAKYDADASGGVIEIYTKRSKDTGWTANLGGNLNQGQRSGGALNGGFRLSGPKLELATTAGYSRQGGFERGEYTRTLYDYRTPAASLAQTNNLDKVMSDVNLSASLNYYLNRRTTLGGEVAALRYNLDGNGWARTTIAQRAGTTLSNSLNDVALQTAFHNYNLFFKRALDTLGSSLLLSTNFAQYHSRQRQTFEQYLQEPGATDGITTRLRNTIPATYHIYTAAADYTKRWSPTSTLEAGLKYTDTRNESRQTTETMSDGAWQVDTTNPFAHLGYQERIGAGYVNLNHTLGKWTLQGGLRAEHTQYQVQRGIDSSYFTLFPNARADYQVSENYSTSLGYAKNIRRPSYESLIPYERFLDNYTTQRGNAFLRPEYGHTFSWNNLYKGYGLQFSYTRTTNAISSVYVYDRANLRLIGTEQNFRQRHLASLLLTVPLNPTKWWAMTNTGSVLYQELSFPDPLERAALYTKRKVYANLSSDNNFTLGRGWTARVYGLYNSPSFNGIFDYGAYSYVSVGVKKALWDQRASLKLDVSDLFYQLNFRVSSNVVPIVTDVLNYTDTRRVRLSFTYNLGKADLKSKRVPATKSNTDELNRLGL